MHLQTELLHCKGIVAHSPCLSLSPMFPSATDLSMAPCHVICAGRYWHLAAHCKTS